jgi:hypothetical protein
LNLTNSGFKNIAEADRARAQTLRHLLFGAGSHTKRASAFPVSNQAVSYVANVGVGSPPTQYSLLVDTGSSNIWVGAGKPYVKTRTSHDTGDGVAVSYGSGSWSGEEYIDQVTLSPSLVIKHQSIGVASKSTGFQGIDGIIGVGPTDLTKGTLTDPLDKLLDTEIPTVTDNLFDQRTIRDYTLGIFFAPTTNIGATSGELDFGGVDYGKTASAVSYVPITSTSPSSNFWGIDQSVSYGGTTILSSTAGIVDTGTTLILIATNAFNVYQQATGGVPDNATGLLKITEAQYAALQHLNFIVSGRTYSLCPNAQIWPRALNALIGGTSDGIYLIVADTGTPSGQGMDFINGFAFLQRYYSVYDTGKRRVGFASTKFTTATSN